MSDIRKIRISGINGKSTFIVKIQHLALYRGIYCPVKWIKYWRICGGFWPIGTIVYFMFVICCYLRHI